MKKLLVTLSFFAIITACGNQSNDDKAAGNETTTTEEPSATEPAPAATSLSDNPDYMKGLELENNNDCKTCHKLGEKLIGPSYREIAAKYESNDATLDSLSNKVIKGGAGNWGQVPMTPHPQLSQADAKAIVKYILLLKK